MTDEFLMRLWADSHDGYSVDFDRGALKLEAFLRGRSRPTQTIGRAYAPGERRAIPDDASMSPTARAALAGVTACMATMGLLLTVALLATADLHPAHAYPMIAHTIVA
jgi:hypothetical protein